MAEPSRIISLTVPLFSSDYAKRNREVAEWNRRARAFSAIFGQELSDEIDKLIAQIESIQSGGVGTATFVKFGIVKTDQTVANPMVYLKSSVDALIAGLQVQIDTINANAIPLIVFTNPGENPIFPPVAGKTGIFGPQRATNTYDGAWWTWNGVGWSAG